MFKINCTYIVYLTAVIYSSLFVGATPVSFEKIQLNNNQEFESCVFADFTGDGKVDIICGGILYVAPNWEKVELFGWYGWDEFDLVMDVDLDGKIDLIKGGYGTGLNWIRNIWPEKSWKPVKIDDDHHHTGKLVDLDGDGKAREIISGGIGPTYWYESVLNNGQVTWKKHTVGTKICNWGYGAGDVNGDGRIDILRPDAWYEAPEDPREGQWKEHILAMGSLEEGNPGEYIAYPLAWIGRNSCGAHGHTDQIYVYDINGDGLNDIMCSSAHRYGILWYEQLPGTGCTGFVEHIIDSSWSQAHNLAFEDMDGDGDPDLVTGKRFLINHDDPGDKDPLNLYWYELSVGSEQPWTRHVISYNEGVGGGDQVGIGDFDNDGDLDIVVTTLKGGPYLFINKLPVVTIAHSGPHKTREDNQRSSVMLILENGKIKVRGPSNNGMSAIKATTNGLPLNFFLPRNILGAVSVD